MTKLEKAVYFSDVLTRSEKWVMLYLAYILEKKGEAYVDLYKVADATGLSCRHLYRILKSLEEKGIIEVGWERYGAIKPVKLTNAIKQNYTGGN